MEVIPSAQALVDLTNWAAMPRDGGMSKAAPSNQADTGSDLQEAAHEAARQAGLTLGQWLERGLEDYAAAAGLRTFDLTDDERIEAVAAQLAALARSGDGQHGRRRADTQTRRANGTDLLREATERLARAKAATQNIKPGLTVPPPRHRAEHRDRANQDSGLRSIAARLAQENDEDMLVRVGHRLRGLASVIADERENETAQAPGRSEITALRHEIGELSRAIAIIAQRASAQGVEPALRELVTKIEETRRDGVSEEELAPVVEILADMRDTLAASPAQIARAMGEEIDMLSVRLDCLVRDSVDHSSFILLRQQIEKIAQELSNAIPRFASIDALEDQIRLLTTRVEQLAAGPRELAARLVELIEGMSSSIGRLDANPALRAIEKSISALAMRDEINPELARQLSTLQESIGALADHPALFAIRRDMAVLAENTGALPKRLIDTLTELRHAVERMATHPTIAKLETRILELHARTANVPANIGETLAELRLSIERLAANAGMRSDDLPGRIDKIETHISRLSQRFEESGIPQVQPVVAQLVSAQHSILQRLDRMREEWPSDRIAELLERVEEMHRAMQPATGTARMEEAVAHISAKIDRIAEASGADPRALQAIENQVLRIAERIERTGETAETIGAIERGMSDLFLQVEEARVAVLEAQDSNMADTIVRDLSGLRSVQDESDQRTRATLNAVHETLEKVVDRLAMLEGDVVALRNRSQEQTVVAQISPKAEIAIAAGAEPVIAEVTPAGASRVSFAPQNSAPEILIEPGSGFRPSAPKTEPLAEDTPRQDLALALDAPRAAQASFIAAARRATQVAGAAPKPSRGLREENEDQTKSGLSDVSRKVLLGVAGAMLLAGSVQGAREVLDRFGPETPAASAEVPQPSASAPENKASDRTLPPAPTFNLPDFAAADAAPTILARSIRQEFTPAEATFEQLSDLAGKGNAAAQFELATRYAEARGVERDMNEATRWLKAAAGQNHAPAQYRLGAQYERGTGVERSLAEAAQLYRKAADAGHIRAMHNLGVLLAEGVDGKMDYAGAAVMFRNAAEHGLRDSQYNLAILHVRGFGVVTDFAEAYKWFALAAAQGDTEAVARRDEVALRMTPGKVAEARKAADQFAYRSPDPRANEPMILDQLVQTPRTNIPADPAQPAGRNPSAERVTTR